MNENLFSKVDHYLSGLFKLEDEVLINTEKSICEQGMPEHSVSANQGQFLYLMAQLCNARRIVEVGTLGGYSTIWLARALGEDGKLTSIEVDPDYARVARKNVEAAGLTEKVEIITGDALNVLQNLEGENPQIDLFFMDADKPNYVNYFRWALRHSRKGSVILADNVIREGKVLDENSTDEKVKGVREYLEMLSDCPEVTSSILQQVGLKEYDGLAISVVGARR